MGDVAQRSKGLVSRKNVRGVFVFFFNIGICTMIKNNIQTEAFGLP
jgi:hypothetical protein